MAVDSDELASLGLALQYDYKGFFTNITAVDLAAILRNAIRDNFLYLGLNVTDRVSYHLNRNLTDTEAIEVLEGFDELDDDRWPWLAVPWITLTIVGGLFVIMRLFTRIRYCGGLRRDDWFLIIAYICSLGNNTQDIWLALEANWPAHIWDKTYKDARLHRLWGLMDGYWWFGGKGAVMLSLLVFYHDLYPGRNFRIACWVMMLLTVVWTICGWLLCQLPCKPYDSWNYLHVFECIPHYMDIATAHTVFNIVLDCCVLILPAHIVLKLKATRKDKIALGVLFGLGILVVIMAILRQQSFAYYDSSKDLSWRAIPVTTWCCVELQTAIICAAIPASRKLYSSLGSRFASFASSVTRTTMSRGGASTTKVSSKPSTYNSSVVDPERQQPKPKRKGFWTILANDNENDEIQLTKDYSLATTRSQGGFSSSHGEIMVLKDYEVDVQKIATPVSTPVVERSVDDTYQLDSDVALSKR